MTDSVSSPSPQPAADDAPRDHHVCPWWIGYLLASPLRRLVERPETLLTPLVEPGMTAVDIGSAMGFFSLPLARLVGPEGRVVCVDVQQRMLTRLQKRARRKGLGDVIETRLCTQDSLGLDGLAGRVDIALAFYVVHETAFPARFLGECRSVLRPGGHLLVAEPRGHVTVEEFERTLEMAREAGFEVRDGHGPRRAHAALLEAGPLEP